jgi:tRNA A-37 threonylcarbamoyl transferase component Bud32
MISFLCSHCGAPLRARPEHAGSIGKCPRCGRTAEAPFESPAGSRRPGRPSSRTVFDSGVVPDKDDFTFLAPALGPDEIGRLGPYRVLKLLGRGGMGMVFEAEDVQLKRRVALKTLKPDVAVDADNRRRFLREAQAMAALEHDHVVSVYQVGEDRGIPYLAMKLLQGESLEDRLNRADGPLDAAEALRIGREIAEGLAAAHERGLIHRDVKPANVLLEAGRDRVKLVDFGVARGADEEVSESEANMMFGTPAYMAPEQAAGKPLDHRADLFGLGCVLYRMTTGELPFKGRTMTSVLTALATTTPRPPRRLDPSVPEALSDLIMRLLSKKPAGRPDSAQEVAGALGRIEAGLAAEDAPAPADDDAEAPDAEGNGEAEEAPAGRRKARRTSGKRKRRKGGKGEVNWERRVIVFGVCVVIGVVLLIIYLIVRHYFFPPAADPAGSVLPPWETPSAARGKAYVGTGRPGGPFICFRRRRTSQTASVGGVAGRRPPGE